MADLNLSTASVQEEISFRLTSYRYLYKYELVTSSAVENFNADIDLYILQSISLYTTSATEKFISNVILYVPYTVRLLTNSVEEEFNLIVNPRIPNISRLLTSSVEENFIAKIIPRVPNLIRLLSNPVDEKFSITIVPRIPSLIKLISSLVDETFSFSSEYRFLVRNYLITSTRYEDFTNFDARHRFLNHFLFITRSAFEDFYAQIHGRISSHKLFSLDNVEDIDINTIAPGYKILGSCVLKCDLRPGETIIIDANDYIILKDDVEAVYMHSGDWIDEFDQNITQLGIQEVSGSEGLSASIEYTERFY